MDGLMRTRRIREGERERVGEDEVRMRGWEERRFEKRAP